jgi:hypothetical protein
VNELWIFSALFNDALNVKLWLLDEIVDGLNATKYTVFIFVFVNSEVRFTRYQQSIFIYQTPDTKTKIITGLLHEIWRGRR